MKRRRTLKTWIKGNVPDDLWPEILSRLPVKSLLRFRCVSTSWRSIIDDTDFTRLHLNRFNNNRYESQLLVTQRHAHFWSDECVVRCSNNLKITSRLGFLESDLESVDTLRTTSAPELKGIRTWFVVGAVDGLVVLKSIKYVGLPDLLMLWNPSIRKTRILPPPPEISCDKFVDFGMGFDPLIEDYKFVRIFLEGEVEDSVSFVAVYTIGTNSWKTIDLQGEECSRRCQNMHFHGGERTLCFRGVLYTLAMDYDAFNLQLVSFDLSSEMFASTRLPEVDYRGFDHGTSLRIIDGGDSLAVVILSESEGSIWALESLGGDIKSTSWTQRHTFSTSIPECEQIGWSIELLSLKKNGEMLLKWAQMVTSYNLDTHKEKILLKKDLKEAWHYMESLILL